MKKLKAIHSHEELKKEIKSDGTVYLLLYKKGTDASDCAYENISKAASAAQDITLLCADVNEVRDIHEHYEINSVPNLLIFDKGELKNIVKGCNENGLYSSLFEQMPLSRPKTASRENMARRVTVYSTPTCSWCNTLKNYLKEKKIVYRDVDISRDAKAAEDLLQRSGQRGVPQTDINGRIVLGFDKVKLNELLGIS
ncbi:MAG: thioredoxin family protein [Candidatus Neomarinimicrobiota bacterium]